MIERHDEYDFDVIAPNFKRRLSGVTSTIVQLAPLQRRNGLKIGVLGRGLPEGVPLIGWKGLFRLWRKPSSGRPFRIWHARRNVEMVFGLILKTVVRAPLRLLFTSAAQRQHKPFTKWLIRQMDAVVATSARSGSYLDVPYRVIMHGVDTELFHPPTAPEDHFSASGLPGDFGIGCFGRIRHQKGTDLFVDAMIKLLPDYPAWTAVISGRVTAQHRDFTQELQKRINAAGLSDRIVFLGEVPDIKLWFRRVSICVAPSRNEGFGLTPLEAMASQTAVVASDAGAYEEMIEHGVTGMLVNAGDGPALTEAIRTYFADPEITRIHGENALSFVRNNFSLQLEADALGEVYESLWMQG